MPPITATTIKAARAIAEARILAATTWTYRARGARSLADCYRRRVGLCLHIDDWKRAPCSQCLCVCVCALARVYSSSSSSTHIHAHTILPDKLPLSKTAFHCNARAAPCTRGSALERLPACQRQRETSTASHYEDPHCLSHWPEPRERTAVAGEVETPSLSLCARLPACGASSAVYCALSSSSHRLRAAGRICSRRRRSLRETLSFALSPSSSPARSASAAYYRVSGQSAITLTHSTRTKPSTAPPSTQSCSRSQRSFFCRPQLHCTAVILQHSSSSIANSSRDAEEG